MLSNLFRGLGHLIGKGGPPRNEEKDQVDDFHFLVISVAGIAMSGTLHLYKLMNDGWLDAYVHSQMPSGQRLLDVDGLKKTL